MPRFNGAASCGTRKDVQTPSHIVGVLLASMGPRLVGRGKRRLAMVAAVAELASMGPRLVGRGKQSTMSWTRDDTVASMGPRLVGRGKAGPTDVHPLTFHRFNGAASCGTRKEKPPCPSGATASMLQWGRVLWDAERILTS